MASIDHFYVFAQTDAPERRLLLEHNLAIGAARRHQGQGTENVCFGFADSYLELLWICDEREAQASQIAPLRLVQRSRWRTWPASPFGVCLQLEAGEAPLFPSEPFAPNYLPAGMRFELSQNHRDERQPMLFALERPTPTFDAPHALASASVTSLRVTTPDLADSSPLLDVRVAGLSFVRGAEHLMEVTLDDGARQIDLRPELPLIIRW